jgi:hypothetical protein
VHNEYMREGVCARGGGVRVQEDAGEEGDVVEKFLFCQEALEVGEDFFWSGLVWRRRGGCWNWRYVKFGLSVEKWGSGLLFGRVCDKANMLANGFC